MDDKRTKLVMILHGFVSSDGKIAGSVHVTRERSVGEVSRYKPGIEVGSCACVNKIGNFDLYFTLAVLETACLFTYDLTTAVAVATNDDVV